MDKFDRIQQLHRALSRYKYPVALIKLAEQLECSEKTVLRHIKTMQQYEAPIEYDYKLKVHCRTGSL